MLKAFSILKIYSMPLFMALSDHAPLAVPRRHRRTRQLPSRKLREHTRRAPRRHTRGGPPQRPSATAHARRGLHQFSLCSERISARPRVRRTLEPSWPSSARGPPLSTVVGAASQAAAEQPAPRAVSAAARRAPWRPRPTPPRYSPALGRSKSPPEPPPPSQPLLSLVSAAPRRVASRGQPRLPETAVPWDAFDLCKLPLLVAEWADGACFEPALNAIQVENMSTAPIY